MFLLGIASGVHCVGMCGGFVAAFNGVNRGQTPITVVSRRVIGVCPRLTQHWRRTLAFNAGRITSYSVAGAVAGTLGYAANAAFGAQNVLYVIANLLLVFIGLHLAGWFSGIERIGAPLWRRLQPHAARAMGANPYVAGLFWGWMPCGLVYGALAVAAFAGSASAGAAAMAAYGLGTLPWLVGAGAAFAWLQKRMIRAVAGSAVLAFGVYGLAHAALANDLRALLCL
jgi:sulfite exporter TauE/SafE